MAISYVGEKVANAINAAGTTQTIILTTSCNPGDFVALFFAGRNTVDDLPTVTDSRGNTWQVTLHFRNSSNVWAFIAATLQDVATLQAGDTITVTATNMSTSRLWMVEEFSGISSTTGDVSTSLATTGSPPLVDSGTTAATSQANELVLFLGASDDNATAFVLGGSYSSFTTAYLNEDGPTSPSLKTMIAGYLIVSSTGTQRETATITSAGASAAIGLLASYTAAGAPAAQSSIVGTHPFPEQRFGAL